MKSILKIKTTKSNKKVKDPEAPKRYRTAYILFTIEKRNQVKKANPDLSPKEILSELGAQWKSADTETKQYFQKLSDAEKIQYEQKSDAYKNKKYNNKENSMKQQTINAEEKINQ